MWPRCLSTRQVPNSSLIAQVLLLELLFAQLHVAGSPSVETRGLPAIEGDPRRPRLCPPLTPLALIRRLLGLLQLLQGGGQALLGPVQLLLHQLDAAVQRGHLSFGLRSGKPSVTARPHEFSAGNFAFC